MKPHEAATQLGISTQCLRVWIQQGDCPFGYVIRRDGKRKNYFINEFQLNEFLRGSNGFNNGGAVRGDSIIVSSPDSVNQVGN